jgi:tail tube protein gp19
MTDVSSVTSGVQAVDSLSANEFAVEIDGDRVTGVFRISGFIAFKMDVKPGLTKVVHEAFKIAKMVQRDGNNVFNRWVRETIQAKDDIARPKRRLDLIAIDDGVETRRWTMAGAWISQIAYSDFNSSSGELVEEILTIEHQEVEESWPAT